MPQIAEKENDVEAKDVIYAKKQDARKRLMSSAVQAANAGIPLSVWVEDETIITFAFENGLDENTLQHIAAWVWKPLNSW